jgi:uncharacterized protein YndB with AHSA1/START domain
MTENQPSVIDEDTFTVRRTIRIAAPVEKVWSAVTEPTHISKWFGEVALDGSGAGARGTITFPQAGAIPLQIEAVDAPRLVSYRWGNDDAARQTGAATEGDASTVFTFTLASVPDGTELTVVETGFEHTTDPAANMADHSEGWVSELDKLVALLEGAA